MERFFIAGCFNMPQDKLLQICKRLIETRAGLGSSELWTNREFEKLSSRIRDTVHTELSPFVLKQIWSKSDPLMPDDFTRDAMAKYAGYDDWKIFALKVLSVKVVESEGPIEPNGYNPFRLKVSRVIIAIALTVLTAIVVWILGNPG